MAGPLQLRDLRKDARMLIAPSLLSADVLNMGSHIDSLCGEADWLHIDIMDGHFVPNLSYGPSLVKALRKTYPDFFLDVHIMVEPAEAFIDMFLAEKPSLLTVHLEAAKHIHRALQKISAAGCAAGVALDPGTPVEALCRSFRWQIWCSSCPSTRATEDSPSFPRPSPSSINSFSGARKTADIT